VTEHYEIRLAGRLSQTLLAVFGGMTVTERPAEPVLRGPIRDQSDLHGILHRADELGLKVIAFRSLDDPAAQNEPAEERVERPVPGTAPGRPSRRRAT
jgi:hypothetical protein